MILAIPYFPGLTDYDALSDAINKKGQMPNHVLRIISRVEDEDKAYSFGDSLSHLFLKSTFHGLEPLERTNIQLSNDFFRAAAKFVYSYAPEQGEVPNPALLYFDPAYRPQKNQWLDAIQSSFYTNQAPDVFGQWKTSDEGARKFFGPFIITKNFVQKSALVDFLSSDTHWREYLQWELGKNAKPAPVISEFLKIKTPKQ